MLLIHPHKAQVRPSLHLCIPLKKERWRFQWDVCGESLASSINNRVGFVLCAYNCGNVAYRNFLRNRYMLAAQELIFEDIGSGANLRYQPGLCHPNPGGGRAGAYLCD